MVRSEKEIKEVVEKLEEADDFYESRICFTCKKTMKLCLDESRKHDEHCFVDSVPYECSDDAGAYTALDWVLEGEPRYSVAELKKILKHMVESWWFSKNGYTVTHEEAVEKFIIFLKDRKRVEEILK